MGKRDGLVEKCAADIKDKSGETPKADLLTKITLGLGLSICKMEASRVSGTDDKELQTVKNNFFIKKLGLKDGAQLGAAIKSVIHKYGSSVKSKYRAVVYYMLAKHFMMSLSINNGNPNI